MASNSIPRRTSRGNASRPISVFATMQPGPHIGPPHSAPSLPHAASRITPLPTRLSTSHPRQHQSGHGLSGSASHAPKSAGHLPRSVGNTSQSTALPAQSASGASRSASHFSRTAVVPPRAPPKQAHMKLKSFYERSFTNWWLWEILAVLLSLSTFSTLVIILIVYNGRNVAQLPQGISLNAVVSILSTISKSSLIFSISATLSQFKWLLFSGRTRKLKDLQLYDDASRGPLGSSLLLLSEKGRSWASIGALITILVLALDPFFQQLIRVSTRVLYQDSPSITVQQALDVAELGPMGDQTFDPSLVVAIQDAAFKPGPVPDTQPPCPTGNCLWPEFASLGFCSSCQDVTQLMQQYSTSQSTPILNLDRVDQKNITFTYSVPIELNGYYQSQRFNYSKLTNITTSTFTMYLNGSQVQGLKGAPRFIAWALSSDGTADTNRTPAGFGLYAFIRTSTSFSSPGTVLGADLCSMSFCLQNRNVAISSGQLNSSVLNTIYADSNLSTSPGFMKVSYIFPNGANSLNLTFGPPTEPALEVALDTLLTGNVSETTQSRPIDLNVTFSSPLMAGFDSARNISLAMDNLAKAMTNYIRDASNHTISGQLGITETYIRVLWPWIALPAFLAVTGTLFLVMGIVRTKKRGAPVWKDSELALLFHGLSGSSERFAELHKISEMDYVASRMEIMMMRTRTKGLVLRLRDQHVRK